MKTNTCFLRTLFAVATLFYLAGCGDGGGGQAGESVMSMGVMTKGSVIVNGVRFEDTTANISIDDSPKVAANLQNGMVVAVSGTVNANGSSGTAQQVVAQSEVRGLVTAVFSSENPPRIVVLGQNVLIDDQTFLNDITRPITNALLNAVVEVHGLRDSLGNIRATRVEANSTLMGSSLVDEIRGVVSNRTDASDNLFHVGTQAVDATGATVTGGSFVNGSIVEVHCTARPSCINVSGNFVASSIEVEDVSGTRPAAGLRFEAEGMVAGFTAHPGSFTVAGIPVTTSSTTTFQGGIATDLKNDIKVEAEGTWDGTTLAALKIEFKRSIIRLQGAVTTVTGNSFTLNIVGAGFVTVEKDNLTSGLMPSVSASCVQVRGQRKAVSGVVVAAGEISSSCSSSGDHLIQAPVEVESSTTLTLLGFAIDVNAPTDMPPYQNLDDTALTQAQFLEAVTPADPGPPPAAGTLVKIRFNPAGTVKQVELED